MCRLSMRGWGGGGGVEEMGIYVWGCSGVYGWGSYWVYQYSTVRT